MIPKECYILHGQMLLLTMRAAQPHLNAHELGVISLVLPSSRTEQREITNFLDAKLTELKCISSLIESQIQTLLAYRKSLIHECVTGQRRVTEADVSRVQRGGPEKGAIP